MAMHAAIMVAPNQARVRATILRAERAPEAGDKWLLEVEIGMTTPVHGPQRARPGLRAQAFTRRAEWDLPVQVEADAEYIGGPRQGIFQLMNLHVCP